MMRKKSDGGLKVKSNSGCDREKFLKCWSKSTNAGEELDVKFVGIKSKPLPWKQEEKTSRFKQK